MTQPALYIIDAGPALNFIASGHERILTAALGGTKGLLHAPETVKDEVLRKARSSGDRRFVRASRGWPQMESAGWIQVLPDTMTGGLLQAAVDLNATARLTTPKDLGETMVVLHAYDRALNGQNVVVIIDDREGVEFARRAHTAVVHKHNQGHVVGQFHRLGTLPILTQSLKTARIPNENTLRGVWDKMGHLDGGLRQEHLDELLRRAGWASHRGPRPGLLS